MTTTLDHIQRLVDELTPLEQVRLLEYLTPRIAHAVTAMHPPEPTPASLPDAWEAFFRIGDRLAASDPQNGPTLTETVLSMRR